MIYDKVNIGEGDIVSIPSPRSYKDCLTLIQSDKYRILGKKCSYAYIIKELIFRPLANPLMWLRLCAYRGRLYRLFSFMYRLSSRRSCLDIPHTTKIGYGFYIGHGICVVINGATIIGNNVNVSQFNNIGSSNGTFAVIGDDVWLGPSVCVVDDVHIGSGASVGAGAVVVKDIPKEATAVGVPAKVVNFNNPRRYIRNKWEWFN